MNGQSVVEARQFGDECRLSRIPFYLPGRNERRVSGGSSVGHLHFVLAGDFPEENVDRRLQGRAQDSNRFFAKTALDCDTICCNAISLILGVFFWIGGGNGCGALATKSSQVRSGTT